MNPGLWITLITLLIGCGGASHPAPSKTLPFDDDDDEPPAAIPRPKRPAIAIRDGQLHVPFPGAVLPVAATALPFGVLPPEQRIGSSEDGGQYTFRAAGIYLDPDHVKHLVLVVETAPMMASNATVNEGEIDLEETIDVSKRPSGEVMWFDPTGGSPPHPWRVWRERSGFDTVLAVEAKDEVVAIRYVPRIQRVRALATDPRIPMVLVERSSEGADDRPVVAEVLGFHASTIKSLLEVDVLMASIEITPTGLRTTTMPTIGAICTPSDLASVGCTSLERDHVWGGGTFTTSAPRPRVVRLVSEARR